jgi:hypothetical protein
MTKRNWTTIQAELEQVIADQPKVKAILNREASTMPTLRSSVATLEATSKRICTQERTTKMLSRC